MKQDNMDEIMKGTISNALRKTFSPEFLNRLDDIIVFNSLQREDIHKIIDISLGKLFKRVQSLGYNIDLTEKAKDFVAEKGYDPKYGARPLNRAIQKYLEDPIAEEILKADLSNGDTIIADYEEGKEVLTFKSENRGGAKLPEESSESAPADPKASE
jgi:ATP-dependent Clp protease ATP-binding subunit ClpC